MVFENQGKRQIKRNWLYIVDLLENIQKKAANVLIQQPVYGRNKEDTFEWKPLERRKHKGTVFKSFMGRKYIGYNLEKLMYNEGCDHKLKIKANN